MKCEDCRLVIEEYLDLELQAATADEVRMHLAECASCAGEARDLQAEQETYARYQPVTQVSPALWTGIQQRIAEDRSEPKSFQNESFWSKVKLGFSVPRIPSWAAAALVLLAIGATAVFMKFTQQPEASHVVTQTAPPEVKFAPPAPPPVSSPAPVAVDSAPNRKASRPERHVQLATAQQPASMKPDSRLAAVKTSNQLVQEAEQKYLAAIAMLSRNAGSRRSHIDRETLARLDQAIASIDRTIAGTRKAVRQHPDDPIAVKYMLSAYARKVDVLREMTAY